MKKAYSTKEVKIKLNYCNNCNNLITPNKEGSDNLQHDVGLCECGGWYSVESENGKWKISLDPYTKNKRGEQVFLSTLLK